MRLALASEYTRKPIRRIDITEKIPATKGSDFKDVLENAQFALRQTFGMELVELPAKQKVTLTQRRAAQKSQGQSQSSSSNKTWVLCSILPPTYKDATILAPSKAPTSDFEAAYIALYTFIITIIVLSGGELAEAKLDRHLKRMNAEQSTPVDKTDKLLKRMIKDGYLHMYKETSDGEEITTYLLGPRGRVEVGEVGIAKLVRQVYGSDGNDEELEQKLERSLKMSAVATSSTQFDSTSNAVAVNGSTKRERERPSKDEGEDDDMVDEDEDD